MNNDTFVVLYFDGSCKGPTNDRKIGMGIAIQAYGLRGKFQSTKLCRKAWTDNDEEHKTNNVAEYKALLYGLYVLKDQKNINIQVLGDSKLVINQVFGDWKVNMPHLKSLNNACRILLRTMTPNIIGVWIPRENNSIADDLAQRGIHENWSWKLEQKEYDKVMKELSN